jgi:hypothetical protein
MSRRYQQPLLTLLRISDENDRYLLMAIILTGSIFTAVEENLCAAASGFSDATAPGLTATSALTT